MSSLRILFLSSAIVIAAVPGLRAQERAPATSSFEELLQRCLKQQGAQDAAAVAAAADRLTELDAADPRLARLPAAIRRAGVAPEYGEERALRQLRRLEEQQPDPEARAKAAWYGADLWLALHPDRAAGDAVQRRLAAVLELAPRSRVAELARRQMAEIRTLGIGAALPEIEAPDLEGRTFKLSEYRGKVVLLDFWADRWSPCRALYPRKRSLAQRFVKRPFVIIGVNGDTSLRTAQRAARQNGLTWRSFWAGPEGPDGPIPTRLHVTTWPRLILLDHEGRIRFKASGDAGLASAITTWVAAAEAAQGTIRSASGKELPSGTRVLSFAVWWYDVGKAALDGQPGILDAVKAMRQRPFGEWDVVYFDPLRTDPGKILARLRSQACPRARQVDASGAEAGPIKLAVLDPVATPGDCFELALELPRGASHVPELPAGWESLAAGRDENGRLRILVQTPSSARPGLHELTIRVTDESGQHTLKLAVDLATRVR